MEVIGKLPHSLGIKTSVPGEDPGPKSDPGFSHYPVCKTSRLLLQRTLSGYSTKL